ncbi:MAG TPA: hypothetical protein VHE78_08595 [Gemmatimonadaceae bacterium]|nr:hypothetical protein [Gemmatimonadaceae bacterium]
MTQELVGRRLAAALSRQGRSRRFVIALALVTTFTTSCKDDVAGLVPLATITVTPSAATLVVGTTQQFTAVGKDANGTVMSLTPIWTVGPGGGTITSAGLFTAGATPGSIGVTATSGAISGAATVNVTAGPLANISVTPSPATVAVGGTQQFTAVGTDAGGNIVTITPPVYWSVAAGGGVISANGMFTAGTAMGTFANTVTATSGTLSTTATVTVAAGPLASISVTPNPATVASGDTQQFIAMGRDAAGNAVPIPALGWSVAAGGGTISAAGLFTAGSASGTFSNSVTATSGSISGTATVAVPPAPVPLATITVSPNPATVAVGATQQFSAVGRDAAGNVVTITPPVAWRVAAGGGTINATGLFTAGSASGTYSNTVTMTSGAISGSATVMVTPDPGPLAFITVSPNPATVLTSSSQQFSAIGRDANGLEVPIPSPSWNVAAGGGSISATGLFTAGSTPGVYTNSVTLTSGGITGSATVIITSAAGPLATITVLPNPAMVPATTPQQFFAIGKSANGMEVPIPSPSWSVAGGGGSISATGLFTAGATPGTYGVTLTSGSISGSATVIVTTAPGPLATITVSPNPAVISVYYGPGSVSFSAVGRDATGVVVPITPVWAVVAGGGTINSSTGEFVSGTALGTFTNTVTATSGSVTGAATVVVQVFGSRRMKP